MQFVAINLHVYLLTKSPLALGLVGLSRGLPIIICSLAGGVRDNRWTRIDQRGGRCRVEVEEPDGL